MEWAGGGQKAAVTLGNGDLVAAEVGPPGLRVPQGTLVLGSSVEHPQHCLGWQQCQDWGSSPSFPLPSSWSHYQPLSLVPPGLADRDPRICTAGCGPHVTGKQGEPGPRALPEPPLPPTLQPQAGEPGREAGDREVHAGDIPNHRKLLLAIPVAGGFSPGQSGEKGRWREACQGM